MIPQDYKERLAAALPSDKNIIVEAGAGTGKTTLLASRLCYLILGKGIKIDQIVALTFTEKAAAEIKLRLLETMRSILADLTLAEPELEITKNLTQGQYFNKTKEELSQAIEESFERIERAQICTIHSFALQLLRQYPLQAGLAPQVEVDSGFITEYIFNKNWSAFLEEELLLTNPRRALWEKLLEHFNLEELKNFTSVLNKPYFDYCKFESSSEEVQTVLLTKIAQAKQLLAFKDSGKERKVERNLKEAINRLETLSKNLAALTWQEVLNLPVQEEIEKATPVKDWTSQELSSANGFIDLANTLTPHKIDLLKQAYNLFSSFVVRVKNDLKKQNIISYDKMILLARDLVQNNLPVRAELKKRYKSLMIDEFQDTDVAQGQLLLFLAEEENSCAKNWQDIILEQGKLFVVGDPKQSIYRFRGANISAYQKFLELMHKQQARPCFLTTNFRSQEKIINFVNKWGSCAIKEQSLIQAPYIPLKTDIKTPGEKPEFLQIISKEPVSVEALRANEAAIVATWIKENVGKTKLADGKTLSYKDITILYSSRTAINIYTEALKRFDIPYNLEASGNFYEAQEIIDILNILKVIYDPQDKPALIGVLRSPLCAMNDEELLNLWQQKALNIFAKDFRSSKAVKDLYKLLRSLNAKAGHITLNELIEEIFYKADFLILETLANKNEQALANLLKFERVALEYASKGFTLAQLLFYIETYGKNDKEDSQITLAEETFDVVNLMTIHKAKGLEAPVVILVDTFREEKKNKPEFFYIDTLNSKIGLSLGPLKNLNYLILQETELKHKQAEKERLLYVALTRARQKLLIGISENKTKGIIEQSLRNAGCYPTADNLENDLFKTTCFPYKDPQSFLLQKNSSLAKVPALDWGAALPLWQARKTEYESYKTAEVLAPSRLQTDKNKAQKALEIGSAVHKTLHLYFQTGVFNLPLALRQLALPLEAEVANTCSKIIENFAQSNILKRLKTMQFLGSEIPFSMYENGVLVNGVIDALFKDSKGKLFLVDFKTDKIDKEELKTYSLKYQQQLMLYRQAVQKMFKNQEVCSVLAYLSLDRLFEI